MAELNEGIDVEELLRFRDIVANDSAQADRSPSLVAHWVGGDRSRVEFGDIVTHIGGEDTLNPMQMLLASFAACDVDLIAMHASFMGLKIESLSVEASGDFNVQSYLGLENKPGPGYSAMSYTVRIRVPGASSEQLDYLRERCEKSSPVGDTLERSIELELGFKAETDA